MVPIVQELGVSISYVYLQRRWPLSQALKRMGRNEDEEMHSR